MAAPAVTTLVFRDNFTGTNGTLLSAHAPDTGTTWALTATYAGRNRIRTNKARGEAASGEASQDSHYNSPITLTGNAIKLVARVTAPSTLSTTSGANMQLRLETSLNGESPFMLRFDFYNFASSNTRKVTLYGANFGSFADSFTFTVENIAALDASADVELVMIGKESWLTVNGTEVDHRVHTGSAPSVPTHLSIFNDCASFNISTPSLDYVEVYRGVVYLAAGIGPGNFGQTSTPSNVTKTATSLGPTTQLSTAARAIIENNTASPGYITNAATGVNLVGDFASDTPPYADPLAAFNAWKALLGVGENPISGFNSGISSVPNASPFFVGGTTPSATIKVSSESGVTFGTFDSAATAADMPITLSPGSSQIAVSPFWAKTLPYANALSVLALVFKNPTLATGLVSGKRSASGTTQLYYFKWSKLFFSTENTVEVAIKLTLLQMEVMIKPAADATGTYFQVFRLNPTRIDNYALEGPGSLTVALTAGTNVYYVAAADPPGAAIGFRNTSFGTAISLSNVLVNASGAIFGAFGAPSVFWQPPSLTKVILRDTFTAANDTLISARPPDIGSNWVLDTNYDPTGQMTIWLNAAGSNNALRFPAYDTALPVTNTYRLKFKIYLNPTTGPCDTSVSVEQGTNGPIPYSIDCDVDTGGELNIRLEGASHGSVADEFFTPSYFNPTAGDTTTTVELIVENGIASWFYINGTLHDFRVRDIQGEQPNALKIAQDGTSAYLDDIEVFVEMPVYTPAGFKSTTFGSPLAVWDRVQTASGFLATKFGTPQFVGLAYGYKVTQFGAPVAYRGHAPASIGPVTKFGTPHWPHLVAGTVTGFMRTKFGMPFTMNVIQTPVSLLTFAGGFKAGTFGIPKAGWLQTGVALSFKSTTFGVPSSVRRGTAAGFTSTAFGIPALTSLHRTTGARTTVFGKPAVRKPHIASSTHRETRWGKPRAILISYQPQGFRSGSFGRPTGYSHFNYLATGFNSTQFGSHAAKQAHRAFHVPPTTMFGVPLVKRIPIC